jgi:hydrogenase-4 component E
MLTEFIMIFLTLANLIILTTSRLSACIRIIACQGILLGILPLAGGNADIGLLIFAVIATSVKGIIFPWMLLRTLSRLNIHREIEPYVGYGLSLFIGLGAIVFSWWISSSLSLPGMTEATTVVPVSLFTLFVGMFLIISRKTALTQVIGYLILENGIYTFGVALAQKQPLFVELAILLDAFVAVFVMGITIFHISMEFDHIDTDRLSRLRS